MKLCKQPHSRQHSPKAGQSKRAQSGVPTDKEAEATPRIRYRKSEQAPFEEHQVLFKAPILPVGPYGCDVIDINGNGLADRLEFRSGEYQNLDVVEPMIHAGTDAFSRPVGMQHLRDLSQKSGKRFHTDLSNWSTHLGTVIRDSEGHCGSRWHDWKDLTQVAQSICPDYEFTSGPSVAIDLKRSEFIIYDPKKAKAEIAKR